VIETPERRSFSTPPGGICRAWWQARQSWVCLKRASVPYLCEHPRREMEQRGCRSSMSRNAQIRDCMCVRTGVRIV
jgi:hypothetical protein